MVKLLEGMLEKSKTDGENDRDVYAAYKCYCDKTDEAKNTAINEAAAEIERMTSFLSDTQHTASRAAQQTALPLRSFCCSKRDQKAVSRMDQLWPNGG